MQEAYAGKQRYFAVSLSCGGIGTGLELLTLPKREFTAQQDFQRQCQKFISENEVAVVLSGGSSISGGKVSDILGFSYSHSLQEKPIF